MSRIARTGRLRRVARGLYDYPRIDPQLGPLTPSADAVAHLVGVKFGDRAGKGIEQTNVQLHCVILQGRTISQAQGPPGFHCATNASADRACAKGS